MESWPEIEIALDLIFQPGVLWGIAGKVAVRVMLQARIFS